jgi:hypothetical protein
VAQNAAQFCGLSGQRPSLCVAPQALRCVSRTLLL